MITVLMPTYNCSRYITSAIRSILNQTFKEFEFLIIDDGSIDDTEELVSSFNDKRINYVKKKHTGCADTLNAGLLKAKYDLIARMDADDIAHHKRLEKQIEYFKLNPKVDVLSSWYAVFEKHTLKYTIFTDSEHLDIKKKLALYSVIPHSGCFYNRRIITEYGEYKGSAFVDYSLWLQIKDKVIFHNLPEVLTFVRYRKNSLSRNELSTKHKMIYSIQSPFYLDLSLSFSIENENMIITNGWREYFYGNKRMARQYWLKNSKVFFKDYRIMIAFILTFLSRNLLTKINESRLRFRIIYLIKYFSQENKSLRTEFKQLIRNSTYE